MSWRRGAIRDRPELEGPGALPRILPWRHRARAWGESPDGLDGTRGPLHRKRGAWPDGSGRHAATAFTGDARHPGRWGAVTSQRAGNSTLSVEFPVTSP